MSTNPLEQWLTKAQAAARLVTSQKTIDRLAGAGKLEKRSRSQVGKPPVVVFNPEDVEREFAARSPAFVVPIVQTAPANVQPVQTVQPARAQVARNHQASTAAPVQAPDLVSILSNVLQTLAERNATSLAELTLKTYLTIGEARLLTGLSRDQIRLAFEAGQVTMRGRRYRRVELQAL